MNEPIMKLIDVNKLFEGSGYRALETALGFGLYMCVALFVSSAVTLSLVSSPDSHDASVCLFAAVPGLLLLLVFSMH